MIRIAVPDTTPPKIKRLLIVGIENKNTIATIFINSEINPLVLNTVELQKLQYELTTINCPFLEHISYADCSKIKDRSYADILNLLKIHIENIRFVKQRYAIHPVPNCHFQTPYRSKTY